MTFDDDPLPCSAGRQNRTTHCYYYLSYLLPLNYTLNNCVGVPISPSAAGTEDDRGVEKNTFLRVPNSLTIWKLRQIWISTEEPPQSSPMVRYTSSSLVLLAAISSSLAQQQTILVGFSSHDGYNAVVEHTASPGAGASANILNGPKMFRRPRQVGRKRRVSYRFGCLISPARSCDLTYISFFPLPSRVDVGVSAEMAPTATRPTPPSLRSPSLR